MRRSRDRKETTLLRRALLLSVLLSVQAGAQTASAPATAPGADDPTVVLDERAYVRSYLQFDWDRLSPAPLKQAVQKKYLSRRDLQSLGRLTKARLAHLKIDWKATDWRDRAVLRFFCPNAGIQPAAEAERYMNAPPPSADWAKADFDDRAWPRQRKPFLVGRPEVGFGIQNAGVRAAFHRMRFFVPDPAAAGDLTFEVSYRGGVRVLINGVEAARGHLPAPSSAEGPATGRADDEAFGDDYPYEAYVRAADEIDDRTRQRLDAFENQGKGRWPAQGLYIPELFGRFDDMPHPHRQPEVAVCHRGTTSVTRKAWTRVQSLRDRRLAAVTIPARLLRKGENVLAIEVRAARVHPIVCREGLAWMGWGNFSWPHLQVNSLRLRAASGRVRSAVRRPAGVQLWVPDIHHRVHDTEWGPPGGTPATVRFVGARNGTYSAQIAVGTDRALKGLKVAAGALKGPGGTIPASALRAVAMTPHPLSDLAPLCGSRSKTLTDPLAGGMDALRQYGLDDADALSREAKLAALQRVHFFDHVGAAGPADVPADSARAAWLYLTVPADATPGKYTGAITVQADGMKPVAVPVAAEVADWALPPPRQFRTLMALEHSPYGVAKQYGVAAFSAAHLKLLAASLDLLGRAGNDWLFVPVLNYTEFGNRTDSPIRWVRRRDGKITHDFSRLDALLDLTTRHMGQGKPPRVIAFVVMHGNPSNPAEVAVLDEATGKAAPMKVAGATLTAADRRRIWGEFATRLYGHMKARGQEQSMFWGYAWDSEGDPTLKYLLAEFTPDVAWTMGGHELRTHPGFYTAFSWIYKVYRSMSLMANAHGWKNPKLEFQNPRGGGSVLCLPGNAPAFGFRLGVDRALTVGTRGLARLGVDYWKESYYDGTRGGEVFLQPGMPVHALFWPGPAGAESSARYEAMLEGLQEAEARIFLEEMLDRHAARAVLPKALADKAAQVIFDHLRSTVFIPAGVTATRFFQYGAAGWQDRSRRLYAAAAEVAGAVKLDVDRVAIAAQVPARSARQVTLKVRNWTARPRAWTASTKDAWIKPARTSGRAATTDDLPVVLDAAALPPGKTARGALTIADAAGGPSWTVAVVAEVSEVFDVSMDRVVFNVPAGGSDGRSLTLMNRSGQPLSWRAGASAAWLKPSPASGTLPAGGAILLKLTASPPDRTAAAHESAVTISETARRGAPAPKKTVAVTTFVLPPYVKPARPAGTPVPLEAVDRKFLVRHGIMTHGIDLGGGEWMRRNDANKPRVAATMYYGWHLGSATLKGFGRSYAKALWVRPHHETVYRLGGSGFEAFSAWVGVPKESDKAQLHRDARVVFEIRVDGRTVANSGVMKLGDAPRLLAATGLGRAKQITLVTRLDSLADSPRSLFFWADPAFHKR